MPKLLSDTDKLLCMTLEAAVALRLLDELVLPEASRKQPDDVVPCYACEGVCNGCHACGDHGTVKRAAGLAQYVAAHGDELMFSSKRGRTAKVFNCLAECLTLMAFAPGGVRFGPLHFDAAQMAVKQAERIERARKLRKVKHGA